MFISSNKKAMSEVISFVLITLLIVIASSAAYFFSQEVINDRVAEIDSKNMVSLFKNLNYKFEEVLMFDGNSFSVPIIFKTGSLYVRDNQLFYQSLIDFQGSDYCFEGICYSKGISSELISINLTNGYNFNQNFSLVPGSYRLFFKNQENVSKIQIKIQ